MTRVITVISGDGSVDGHRLKELKRPGDWIQEDCKTDDQEIQDALNSCGRQVFSGWGPGKWSKRNE